MEAILPLWGKMLNVEKARLDKVYGNEKLIPVVLALGCGIGDDFAVLKKGKEYSSRVSQSIKHLVPGRLYCFQCCMFDVKAVKNAEKCDRRVELDISIVGATVLKEFSWRHIDRRVTDKKNNPAVNLEHIVFRAESAEAALNISNKTAPEGSELGINFISLCPYYQEGEETP